MLSMSISKSFTIILIFFVLYIPIIFSTLITSFLNMNIDFIAFQMSTTGNLKSDIKQFSCKIHVYVVI